RASFVAFLSLKLLFRLGPIMASTCISLNLCRQLAKYPQRCLISSSALIIGHCSLVDQSLKPYCPSFPEHRFSFRLWHSQYSMVLSKLAVSIYWPGVYSAA